MFSNFSFPPIYREQLDLILAYQISLSCEIVYKLFFCNMKSCKQLVIDLVIYFIKVGSEKTITLLVGNLTRRQHELLSFALSLGQQNVIK